MQRPEPGRNVMWWALGISIAFHALLILASFWIPVGSSSAEPVTPEDAIEFTFAEERSEDEGEKPGDVPLPDPLESQSAPPPQPAPTLPDRVPPPVEPQPESPAQRPQELPPVDPQPLDEEPEKNDSEQQEEPEDPVPDPLELEDADQPEGSELEEQSVSPFASPGRPTPRPGQPPASRIGLDRALRQFREEVIRNRPAPEARGSFENVFVPDMADLPLAGSPYAFLEHESRDFDFSDYDRQIYFRILFAWYARLYETAGEFEKWGYENRTAYLNHRSRVTFTIRSNGDVTDIAVTGPAGCQPLDESAANALDEVILPPLPDDFPRDKEVIHATFLAQGEIRSLRPYFERLKRLGYF